MDRRQRIYDELRKKLSNPTLTKDEKVNLIRMAGEEYNKEVDKEYNRYVTKQRIGAALEIGSAAIPVGGVINVGARASAPLLKKAATSKPVQSVVGKVINSAAQKLEKGIPMPEISKSITEQFGRKIPQDIVKSGIHGAIEGSVFGIGRGLMEDKNPVITSIQDGVLGLGLGAGIGGTMSKLEQKVLGNKLGQYGNIDILSPQERKQYYTNGKKYYQNYIQGININKNEPINFSGRGLKEILTWNPNQVKNFSTLVEDIKTANRLPDAPNIKPEQKPNVSHYEVYQGNNGLHKIEVRKDGTRRYYFTKDDAPKELIPTTSRGRQGSINNSINDYLTKNNPPEWLNSQLTVGAESLFHNNPVKNPQTSPVLRTLGNTSSADRIPLPNLRINSSINDYLTKNNPPEWLNPQLTVGAESLFHNNPVKNPQVDPVRLTLDHTSLTDRVPLPNLRINGSINDYLIKNNPPERLNPQLTVGAEEVFHKTPEMLNTTSNFITSHLSAPTQYRNLSFDKSKDESSGVYKIGISYNDIPNSQDKIFTPAEIGNMSTEEFTKNESKIFEQVKNGQIQPNKIDYSKFSNPYSNNRIYTAEEFGEMPSDEMAKNKEAINHQIGQIGLPTNQDMENSAKSGGVVYVEGYTRSDGTKVKGYYRSK